MEAITFCKVNNGFGLKKINQDCFVKAAHVQRKFSVGPSPRGGLRPLRMSGWNQGCQEKSPASLLRFKSDQSDKNLFKCNAEVAIAPTEEAPIEEQVPEHKEEELSRGTLLWRAAKLPMYTVALIPVTVGSAAAYYQTGVFSLARYLTILASYVIVNVWVNLSNDVYDFDTGVDKNKKESVVNLFGSRNGISAIAWSLLVLGFSGLSAVALTAGSPRSVIFLAAAVFGFFLYQCPPFRLSYYGVGEPLLFLAYGPFSTIGFYLLNSIKSEMAITSTVAWSSVLVGLTTALILFCSHFHQIKDDKAVGKISPLVRLGTETGSHVVKWSMLGLYTLTLVLGMTKALPLASVLLCALTLPMGNLVVSFVQKNHKDNSKIFMGKYFCVRLHTIFGAALAAGLVVARMFSKQLPQAVGL